MEGKKVDNLCAFKNMWDDQSFSLPRSPLLSYDAVISPADSVVSTVNDNFSSCARPMLTKDIVAEDFNCNTSPCGGVRLPDESLECIWHDADEFVGGEE